MYLVKEGVLPQQPWPRKHPQNRRSNVVHDGTLVVVLWRDIVGDDNWLTRSEARATEPHAFTSIGWLLRKDKKSIVITACYSPDDDTVSSVTSIPMGAVLDVKTVKGHRMPNLPVTYKQSP